MPTERHAILSGLWRLGLMLLTLVGGSAIALGQTTIFQYDNTGRLRQVRDTSSDVNNCGALANVCATGEVCCWGTCTNLANSASHCGSCGNACSAPSNAYPRCWQSQCEFGCNYGYTYCSATNSCRNLSSDVDNCGTCGNVCRETADGYARCLNGQCSIE